MFDDVLELLEENKLKRRQRTQRSLFQDDDFGDYEYDEPRWLKRAQNRYQDEYDEAEIARKRDQRREIRQKRRQALYE